MATPRKLAVPAVLLLCAVPATATACTTDEPVAEEAVATPVSSTSVPPSPTAPPTPPSTGTAATPGGSPSTTAGFTDGGDPLRAQQTALAQLAIPAAWSTATGTGQVIAVVDTGVDLDHPDLAAQLVDGVNLIEPGTPPQDDNGHGTHVAGIAAAATGNGIGGSGVAPSAKIMPVKVLDRSGAGDPVVIANGVRWAADHGATVINLSLGGSGLAGRLTKGGPINLALREASTRGVVIVAASGNEAAIERDYRVGVAVIVVNACDASGSPADFSNVGDPRAVTAPGVDIISTAPTAATDIWPKGTDGYEALSGTSMASPVVAGVVALLLSHGVPPDQISERLSSTARNPSQDARLGAGVISPVDALR